MKDVRFIDDKPPKTPAPEPLTTAQKNAARRWWKKGKTIVAIAFLIDAEPEQLSFLVKETVGKALAKKQGRTK